MPPSIALVHSELLQPVLEHALAPDLTFSDPFARLASARPSPQRLIQGACSIVHMAHTSGITQARYGYIAPENARSELVHQFAHAGNAHISNFLTTILVRENAELLWVRLNDAAAHCHVIENTQITLQRGARLRILDLQLGGGFTRHALDIQLAGENASVEIANLMLLGGRQHADLQLNIQHQAPNCQSKTRQKVLAEARARAVFNGRIFVAAGSDGTDAQLKTNSLLLSPNAEINAKPELEIHADDVSCSHGATIGQLDEQALFYLQARGIDALQARAMLSMAFCMSVFTGFEQADFLTPDLQSQLHALLQARFSGVRGDTL
jgi:Fe-S cluster assembly protein SufD